MSIPEYSEDQDSKTILNLPDPLFVVDTHDPGWYHTMAEEEWATDQGMDASETFRYEIYVIDTLCARVFTYQRDDRGWRVYEGDRPLFNTEIIPISSMPPKREGQGSS